MAEDLKLTFEWTEDSEFNGQMVIEVAEGDLWRPKFFEFHEVLAAMHWLGLSLTEARAKREAIGQGEFVQEIHKAYMNSKYPGWPETYVDKKFRPAGAARAAEPPTRVVTNRSLEDLGL